MAHQILHPSHTLRKREIVLSSSRRSRPAKALVQKRPRVRKHLSIEQARLWTAKEPFVGGEEVRECEDGVGGVGEELRRED